MFAEHIPRTFARAESGLISLIVFCTGGRMTAREKRAMACVSPKNKFESIREATRHKDIRKRHGQLNAMKPLILTPAAPHSKAYGH